MLYESASNVQQKANLERQKADKWYPKAERGNLNVW